MRSFADILRAHLDALGFTQREFAERSGISHGNVSDFLGGRRSVPLDRVEGMADALGLAGEYRAELAEAALLTHASQEVRDYVANLKRKLARAERASA